VRLQLVSALGEHLTFIFFHLASSEAMASPGDGDKRCVLLEPFPVCLRICALAFCQVWIRSQVVSALGQHLTFIFFIFPAGSKWQALATAERNVPT
jgi:hypothetical protein